VSRASLVFLDANVIFSAALGGPAFELILGLAWDGRLRLVSSRACLVEAELNLERKRPDRRAALAGVLAAVSIEAGDENGEADDEDSDLDWAAGLVHPDDAHVLAAARRVRADVLLTGDTKHFGALMERGDLGLRVRTPRAFLLEGPTQSNPGSANRSA
jgi:predicted nucleic acid-binding protein